MGIEVRNATFGYGSEPVICGLDLPVRDNKVLTVLGRNGVGKTTLLKCMMGFLKWRSGETLLDGRPLKSYSLTEVWSRISYVPQAKRSPFAFSVLDTVVMGLNASAKAFSVPSREDYEKAHETLADLGVAGIEDKDSSEISGGELQMVLIARALVSDPRILILDEPESNLDMRNQLRVLGAIQKISERGTTTCIINTHFPEHALLVSDDTLFLGGGSHMLLGPTPDVVTRENIRDFYGVDAAIVPVGTDLIADRTRCDGAKDAGDNAKAGGERGNAKDGGAGERGHRTVYPFRICPDCGSDRPNVQAAVAV